MARWRARNAVARRASRVVEGSVVLPSHFAILQWRAYARSTPPSRRATSMRQQHPAHWPTASGALTRRARGAAVRMQHGAIRRRARCSPRSRVLHDHLYALRFWNSRVPTRLAAKRCRRRRARPRRTTAAPQTCFAQRCIGLLTRHASRLSLTSTLSESEGDEISLLMRPSAL